LRRDALDGSCQLVLVRFALLNAIVRHDEFSGAK
jgi:hypothetical protein